jgi:PIN domain nuclease of toxin-antitoxin system
MKYLLDTHALIWFIIGDEKIHFYAKQLIENEENEILVSIASLWEIAIKYSLGKLQLKKTYDQLFPEQLEENNIDVMIVKLEHLKLLCNLPFHHRDPFDRIIICQALFGQITLISKDTILDNYKIKRVWEKSEIEE